jgi:hypothetical protein
MRELADEMRAAGARRVRLSEVETPNGTRAIIELELLDTIPAPPPFEELLPEASPEPGKDPSLCAGVGCSLPGGWHATPYCRAHGLSAAGVRT